MARGRRPLPWIKLWFDILGDPKMTRLSGAEKWCWVGILLLAGQSPIRGELMLTKTQPMTVRDISQALNLTNREVSSLKSCISKMIELDSLRWNSSNCLEVINFEKRQGKPQYICERELKVNQHEKPVKETLVQRLWANEWQPTGDEIVLVESEKRIGNLYIDILARTKTGSLILIEVKPFSLHINHLGQVSRYISALKMQDSAPVFAFLIGRDRQNITDSVAKSAGIAILTYDELPFNVGLTVKPTVKPTLNQHYIEGEGRGEKKDLVTPLPVGKGGGNKKPPDPRVREIFDEIRKFFGYPEATNKRDPIPNHAKEGQFIKKMLSRGFTRDDILSCWRAKVQQRHGEFVSMVWVNEDIGNFVRRGEALPASPKEGQNQAMTTSERRQYEQRESEGRGASARKSDSLQDYVERSRKAGLTVIVSGEEADEGNEDRGV